MMTQVEFARHRGVSKPAVTAWKKKGLLIFVEGEHGRPYVDVVKSAALVDAMIDPMRGRPTKAVDVPVAAVDNDKPGLSTARADLLNEQLVGQRIKNAQASRELGVNAELVRRAGEMGRMVRERIGSMHRSLSERLAVERDPRAITALLENEMATVLTDLADAIENGMLAEDEPILLSELEAA
jgi:phage terminase Nu1 subunit (DNA packaging protein)